MVSFGRRAFLMLAGMLVGIPARLLALQRPITLAEFLRLSSQLTGRNDLDEDVGRIYLDALSSVPANVALLGDLASGRARRTDLTPAHAALERDIITAWYTGTYQVNGETRLATHTGALMWSALGMVAPGTCVGSSAPWSQAPPVR